MQRGTAQKVTQDLYNCFPEPAPDYQDDEDDDYKNNKHSVNGSGTGDDDFPPPPPPLTADELSAAVAAAYDANVQNGTPPESKADDPPAIKPKPLHNPCVESKERQALHKELLLNYKIGKDVLQKPELNKVLRERRETQRKKEWDEHKSSKGRTSLEVKLEERANRMKEEEEKKMKVITEDAQAPELLRMHRKITKSVEAAENS